LDALDRRSGQWTRLQLIEMNDRFLDRMRRAHPELAGEDRE